MPKKAAGLTAAGIKTMNTPGRFGDGRGLYLFVRDAEHKYFVFRWMRDGVAREAGLGPAHGRYAVTLAEAREAAHKFHIKLRAGIDPVAERAAHRAARTAERAVKVVPMTTFKSVAEQYVAAHEKSWKNAAHRAQWTSTLKMYAYPVLGELAVDKIETGHLTKVLIPIWESKTETASRLRGRIEVILDYAKSLGWRSGENPARWQGHLKLMLAKPGKLKQVTHHAALNWQELPAAMTRLADASGSSALCLRFIVLTAVRSNEARSATWGEIDLKARVWTIPGARMKTGVEHRVPLSDAALAVLQAVMPEKVDPAELVFLGGKKGKPLSDVAVSKALAGVAEGMTVHGMRSTFRDWCAEATNYPREICEQALAHQTGSAVEQAYMRSDLLSKRRHLMDAWGSFATTPYLEHKAGDVVLLHGAKSA